MLRLGVLQMLDKQIKLLFLVDGFVFDNIKAAKKFIVESSLESSEKDNSIPFSKGRDN